MIGKKLTVTAIVLYLLVAHIGGHFLKVHWIHVFNSFMLVCILHNILEWKYDWIEQEEIEEENNADETLNK